MKEKRKILHVVEAMGGGVFTYLVELANGMCEDFDVTIALGIRSETPENYESYFDERVSLVQVENFTRGLNPVKDLRACIELKKNCKGCEAGYYSFAFIEGGSYRTYGL